MAPLIEIVDAVKKVNDIVEEISTASEEQTTGLVEINKAMGGVDEMTQQNTALVEQAAAASGALTTHLLGCKILINAWVCSAASMPSGVRYPPSASVISFISKSRFADAILSGAA